VTKKLDPLSPERLSAASQTLLPVAVWSKHRVLVAVSGGADSVALFRTINGLRNEMAPDAPTPEVVHVNHGIRGDHAERDANFVNDLATTFDANFHLKSILLDANGAADLKSENALRELRYDAILEVAREIGARYVFTGHHQGDQVETILFRIFRGTGLAGLTGIPAVRVVDETVSLVRPFLEVERETIIAALAEWKQDFCHDQSNDGDDYSRNFLRNALLPEARSYFGPHVDQSIVRLSHHALDALEIEAAAVEDFLQEVQWQEANGPVELPMERLQKLPPAIVRAVLIRLWKTNQWPLSGMTYGHWLQLSTLVSQNNIKGTLVKNLPGNVRAEVDSQSVRLFPPSG